MLISRFYNGLWVCQNIVNVLNQFNFFGNAIAMDHRSKEFYDPMNSWTHVEHRIMRAIRFDYPEEQINDVLRITRPAVVWFRILHYAALIPLTIEPVTKHWLLVNRSYLSHLQEFESNFFVLAKGALEIIDA